MFDRKLCFSKSAVSVLAVPDPWTKFGSFFWASLLTGLICLTLASGCAQDSEDGTDAQASKAPESRYAISKSKNRLVGVWLGKASINEAKLQGKLEQLATEYKNGTIARAQSFLSTTMAIEYKEDGSVENDLELVSVDGQMLRDGSVGTWSVIESRDDGLLIETQEVLSDGTTATSQFDYKFVEDGQFVLAVPVSEDLQDCDATLVFKRQTLPPVSVAESDLQTLAK